MNNMILMMPRTLLKNYVKNNFDKLSEKEFFQLIKRGMNIENLPYDKNEKLSKSKMVLKYVIEKSNANDFEKFDISLFDEEIFRLLIINKRVLNKNFIENNLFLLDNEILCMHIIKTNITILPLLSSKNITKGIIDVLIENNIVLDKETLLKHHALYSNDILASRTLLAFPETFSSLPRINKSNVDAICKTDYVPTKDDFYNHYVVRNNKTLLLRAFAKDPSFIVFFPMRLLNDRYIASAFQNGYRVSEEDLKYNQNFCKIPTIMNYSIKKNPELIKYAKCLLLNSTIDYAVWYYKLTKKDFDDNPELGLNSYLIQKLGKEFKVYSYDLTQKEKMDYIKFCLKNNDLDSLINLPFFKKQFSKMDTLSIKEFINSLKLEINDDNIDDQERYSLLLDKFINAILRKRYSDNKKKFLYPSVDVIDVDMKTVFDKVIKNNNMFLLEEFKLKIFDFVNFNKEVVPYNYIQEKIDEFFLKYKDDKLTQLDTNEFFNDILNKHRDLYYGVEKQKIISMLMLKLPLTNKKMNTILNHYKTLKISDLIRNNELYALGINEDNLKELLMSLRTQLSKNKDIRKSGIIIKEEWFTFFEDYFLINGKQDANRIDYFVKNKNISKIIADKYNQLLFKFIDKVELDDYEKVIPLHDKKKLGFNYNNYLIASSELYLDNISKILLSLDDSLLESLMVNKDNFSSIVKFIPFANLIDEFGNSELLNILTNLSQIKEIVLEEGNDFARFIINKFDSLIYLGNGLASVDDIQVGILGNDVVNTLGAYACPLYLTIYRRMLQRNSSLIPPISIKYKDRTYESGNYHDPERLLIGKKISGSCVDIGNAGSETYEECLLENTGDVIIVKNADNQFVGRILLFRRGNIIQLEGGHSINGNIMYLDEDLIEKIANEILEKSKKQNDNIEYVFLSGIANINYSNKYPVIHSNVFLYNFPHADFTNQAYLIGSVRKNETEDEILANIVLDADVSAEYKLKSNIQSKDITNEMVSRIKILQIFLEDNEFKKSELSRNYRPFYKELYIKIFVGEFFYIALGKDGTIEKVVLPTITEEELVELNKIESSLLADIEVNEIERKRKK